MMAESLWYFWIYSFLGFALEKILAAVTRAENQTRKCFLLLPLCPVYGLGMLAVLALPPELRRGGWLICSGAVVTTAVEYAVHWGYERFLGVRFWDYSKVWGNVHGRVCLPFTAIWGLLTALAVWWVQPWVESIAAVIPWQVTYIVLLVFTADAVCSAQFLRKTHDIEGLRWAVHTTWNR